MAEAKTIAILEQMMSIEPRIRIWSGRTSIETEELNTAENPPKEFNSTIPICDNDDLREARKIRTDVEFGLGQLGIKPSRSSFLISQEKWPEALQLLQENQQKFEEFLTEFLANHDDKNLDFPSRFPGWEHLVEDKLLSSTQVQYKFGFSWTAYAMTPAPESIVRPEDAGLEALVDSFGDSLFHEIAVDARKSYKASKGSSYELWFQDASKTDCTAKALSPLRRISEKLGNLLLLHPSAVHIRDLVDDVISKLPSKGPYAGSSYMMIKGVLEVVASEKAMEEYGRSVQSNRLNSEDFLNEKAAMVFGGNAPEARAALEEDSSEDVVISSPELEEDSEPVFELPQGVDLWNSSEEEEEKTDQTDLPSPAFSEACVVTDASPFF